MTDIVDEAALQTGVIDTAHLYGFLVAHFRPAQNSKGQWRTPVAADGKGFVDLTLAKPGRLIMVELKGRNGRLTPEQKMWGEVLSKIPGIEYYVWKPVDWPNTVVNVLRHP